MSHAGEREGVSLIKGDFANALGSIYFYLTTSLISLVAWSIFLSIFFDPLSQHVKRSARSSLLQKKWLPMSAETTEAAGRKSFVEGNCERCTLGICSSASIHILFQGSHLKLVLNPIGSVLTPKSTR